MNKKVFTYFKEAVMLNHTYRKSVGSAMVAFLALGSVTLSAADAPAPAPAGTPDPVAVAKEVVTREANKRDADRAFQEGVDLFSKGEYEKAIEKFLKALDIVKTLPIANPQEKDALIEKISLHIANSYHCWAEDLYTLAKQDAAAKKYDDAIAKCRKAAEMYKPCEDLMNQEIAKYEAAKRAQEFKDETRVDAVLPDFEDTRTEIETALQRARSFYKIGRWTDVIEQCKIVFSLDPYNTAAIDLQRRATIKLIEAGKRRKDISAQIALNEANWGLVPPVLISATEVGQDDPTAEPTVKQDPTKDLRSKLDAIKFNKLTFEKTPLDEVIRHLRTRSKELDPSGKGVNFVLLFNMPNSGNSEEGKDGGDEDEFGDEEEDGGDEESSEMPTVSFYFGSDTDEDDPDAEKISLETVIKNVCLSAGLHYRIEEHAVVIAPENIPLDDNITLFFMVEAEQVENMENSVDDGDTVSEDGEERSKLMVYFERKGVKFGKKAKVVHDEMSSKLIVTNTPENLDRVAEILRTDFIKDPQVQIQVKFMEISQNDLEEIGFEYVLSRTDTYDPNSLPDIQKIEFTRLETGEIGDPTWTSPEGDRQYYLYSSPESAKGGGAGYSYVYTPETKVPQGKVPGGTQVTFSDPENTTWYYAAAPVQRNIGRSRHSMTFEPNSAGLLRYAETDPIQFGSPNNTSVSDTVFNWSRVTSSGHRYEARLHALDQADSADILTCPRITTIAGEEATLMMVTTKIYPTEWEEASLDEADGTSVFTPSTPDVQRDSDGQVDEGITLTVTPNIDGDEMYVLNMDMEPTILDFAGWVDYSYQIILDGEEWPNTLKMPIIEVRSVSTKVVCYDRSTVVLGGIVKDNVSMVDDQIPILGDLPIIGRLFQSKGKGSQKTNLLIFLTATLVNPDGSFYRPDGTAGGLPSF